jgi:secreted trypsin-like serine protease
MSIRAKVFSFNIFKKNKNNCAIIPGDSGSPMQFIHDGTFQIVGLTSFGVSCVTNLPSFYTRVSSYLDWIEKTVWPDMNNL